MADKRKITLLVLLTTGVLVAIALTLDYDSPELGRALLAQAGKQANLDVKAQAFHLNLLRGLKLEGVEITSRASATRFDAKADRLVFEHRFLPLLRGQVEVDQVVLERPEVEIVSKAEDKPRPRKRKRKRRKKGRKKPPPPEASSDLGLRITRFAIVGGSFVIHDDDDTTELHGVDLELRDVTTDPAARDFLKGLTARGEISADRVVTSTAQAENAEGRIEIGAGHLQIEDLRLPTAQGRLVVGELDADFNADPYVYTLDVSGTDLDTNLILGGESEGGLGPARLALEVSGDGSEKGNVSGTGVLSLETGTLPALPVLAAIELLVARTRIIGAAYGPFEIRFRVADERVELEPFEIRFGELALALSGSVGFEGELDLRSAFTAPRDGVGALEIPKEIVEILTDPEGRLKVPLEIGGTKDDPDVDFDRTGWGEVVIERLEDELVKELGKALDKLFGKDDR